MYRIEIANEIYYGNNSALITSLEQSSVIAADDNLHSRTRSFVPDHHDERSNSMTILRPLDVSDVSEDEDSSDNEEYHSFESDTPSSEREEERELTEEEKHRDHKARALERQRVMEAAGLIIKAAQGSTPPPRPLRRRRTPPQTPQRQSTASLGSNKDLPPPPPPEPEPSSAVEPALHVDDAFERYENFLKTKDYRLSVASFDSGPPPSPGAGSISPPILSASNSTSGKEGESRAHSFFGFLGRSRTPGSENERPRLQISAPIPLAGNAGSMDAPSPREASPAFGSVGFPRTLFLSFF
jgi:hypothetical protein